MNADIHPRPDTDFMRIVVCGLIAMWFAFSLQMGWNGRYVGTPGSPPIALGLSVVLPIIAAITAYRRRGAFWAFCQTIDLRLIVAVHAARMLAIDFLLTAAEGRLPPAFAIPAGVGDILVGAAAIPLALALGTASASTRGWYRAWNLGGLFDLGLAITLGILHSPSPIGVLAGHGPTSLLMSELPRSLVPTFLVPMYVLLHCLALARREELGDRSAAPA
jgi:hypothetical protein